MAAWLIQALRLLASSAAIGGASAGAFTLATEAFGGGPNALTVPGAITPFQQPDIRFRFNPATGQMERVRRRRRRRALTASDRADIAFIAGILGPKAGKDIAAIIAART